MPQVLATTGAAAMLLAGCGSNNNSGTPAAAKNTKVGILLPDTATSPRWVSADPNELNKQCIAYQLTCYVDNATAAPPPSSRRPRR